MSARRSHRRSQPGTARRSLRLQAQKVPFSDLPLGYQRPITSTDLKVATPRFLFKKVLQTQPVISPLVPVQPKCSLPVESILQLPLSHSPRNSSDSSTKENFHSAQHNTVLKDITLFERGVDNQLDSVAQSALENTSPDKVSFRTPAPLEPAGKKGLLRRPRNYRSLNVKDFQEGIDENLQRAKESQSDLLDSVLNDTEKHSVSTELFAQPQFSGQDDGEASTAPSQLASAEEGVLPPENSCRRNLNTAQSALENTPLTKSLQVSFRTPAPLEPAGKKGLLRRPRNYRSLNVKDFQEGIDENLQRAKESQSDLLDSVLNDTEKHSVSTELFAQPQFSGQDDGEASTAPSQLASAEEGVLPPENSCRRNLNTEVDPARSSTPVHHQVQDIQSGYQSILFNEKSNRRSVKKMVSRLIEELDKSISEAYREEEEDEAEEELFHNEKAHQISQKNRVETPGSFVSRRNTKELKNPPATQIVDKLTPQMGKGSELQEMLDMQTPEAGTDPESEEMTDSETDFDNIAHQKTQRTRVETPGSCVSRRNTKELKNPPATQIVDGTTQQKRKRSELQEMLAMQTEPEAETDPESEEMTDPEMDFDNVVNQISPRTRVETPGSCVSRRNTRELKNPPATQHNTQQICKESELQEMLDMQTEPEGETDPESEEMTDPETDIENVDPTGKTPAFVRARAFDSVPLLATPHTLNVDASRPSPKQGNVKWAPVPSRKADRKKRVSELPSSLIKKLFSHYVKMPVSKDAFGVVERSINLYFKHLCDDLEAFTKHAGRKITEPADVELLMRRQGLITEKKPLNVLIEQHMPLEYRKLLLPVATSGNKVVPAKQK